MATELYDLTVPVFLRGFAAMAAFLEKARAHADEHGVAHDDLLTARLYEDMAPLTSQIQRASDAAKFAVSRLAAIEPPAMPDTEASFDELQARIAATVAFLNAVPREAIDGREDADIELKTPSGSFPFKGRGYVLGFALPNFYFHVTTAYAILRHKGVPLGKRDYLGGIR
ncbi:DUF1993 domain-containing protein [Sphingomonas psychrotolerans]|uniref:DUF1993 domain-containing protein n=1 Tax=Sphingomonas psychrotolerans TaxID=1327635 RepID=A0ABU3MY43_9SPHN|nr:DUF1993 domain-containing protein [Sphingomonas psychrotolerans]MDT8757147.1 DUF1993 domain-containing protein [Sphingomonas psychrotolerans]